MKNKLGLGFFELQLRSALSSTSPIKSVINDINLLLGLEIVDVVLLGEARGGGVARVGKGGNET